MPNRPTKPTFALRKFFLFMRRVIRIKAMQGLYTYFNNKTVNWTDLCQKVYDSLIEVPEFYNSTDAHEKQGFQKLLEVLQQEAFEGKLELSELMPNQQWLGRLAQHTFTLWENENRKEIDRIRQTALSDIKNQAATEVAFWQLFSSLLQWTSDVEDRKQNKLIPVAPSPAHELKILNHPFWKNLLLGLHPEKGSPPAALRSFDREQMGRIYQSLFNELPEYQEFKNKKEVSDSEMEDIWKVLYRKLYRSEVFNEVMGETDLHWSENRIFLEVRLKSTHRKLAVGEIPDFAPNREEEDEFSSFFKTLLDSCLTSFEADEYMIRKVLTTWDPERISILDRYLIHLAITELRQFPHIPIKVTINEYLEIAKAYSTPNSSGFINGIVDKLAKNLRSEGAIKKSARGLMDNR